MRQIPLFWTLLGVLAAGQGIASAQAMVENAMGAARAATTAAPAKGIAGALNNMEKTLNKSLNGTSESAPAARPKAAGRSAAVATVAPPVAPPPPAVHYEDPEKIGNGMAYGDVVKRFGPAELEIITGMNTKSLSYRGHAAVFQIEVVDGKVASISDLTNGTIVKN